MQIDRLRSLPRPLAFIFPGGGALAAYQVGVLDALTAQGLRPDRLIGVSAGAMNAALFAWSSGTDGVRRLERIWADVKRRDLLRVHPGRMRSPVNGPPFSTTGTASPSYASISVNGSSNTRPFL